MAEVANDSVNPDIRLLRGINDLARQAPRGVDRVVEFLAEYGVMVALAAVTAWCWWRVARRSDDAPAAVAGVAWSVLAAGVTLLLGIPVRALVARPRPYEEHDGLDVLARAHGFSFVSDRSAVAGAVAVGLFMVSRKLGAVGGLLAAAEGFGVVYLGLHYPTDVIGGYALGAATTLLLAPPALALLTAATTALARSRWAVLVRVPARAGAQGGAAGERERERGRERPRGTQPAQRHHSAADKDLAA
ncbi:phosphatase PAP2 family protein [Streptomyces sp. HPF1205]|uniref:phosphatase PAP2 family protein n=1 Tax=Streptomyces sp. HPF1205 TaxID=2873262 RepID=UPI001CEDE54D|nr:phosphatase PAP2 family protein [Streptomyces sp. HPF1205]